jgi:hypothetical protein
MEQLPWMFVVLSLVIIAVAVTIYQTIAENQSAAEVFL